MNFDSLLRLPTQMSENITPPNLLYSHYFDDPERPNNFNASNQMIDQNCSVMRHNWIHTNVPPPTLLNSSNYLTKSYSTLSDQIPPNNASTVTSLSNPKVLTRTQSCDPRLNPQKELQPITPKRKLSINEYRKRKQLSLSKSEDCEKNAADVETSTKNTTAAIETKETGKSFDLILFLSTNLPYLI